MKCKKCGKEIPDKAVFCPSCGMKITTKKDEAKSEEQSMKKADTPVHDRGKSKKTNNENEKIKRNDSPLAAKSVKLFGNNVTFSSRYFIEAYIYKFFRGKISALGKRIENELRELNVRDSQIGFQIAPIVINGGSVGCKTIEELSTAIGLDDDTTTAILGQYRILINAYGQQMEEVGQLFAQIDEEVDEISLQKEYRKATRPRFQSYGFGMKGLAKAVVTQSALNAGTGLLYGAANKINMGFVKNQAAEKKAELLDNCIKIVRDFFDEGETRVPDLCLEVIGYYYPDSIWNLNEDKVLSLEREIKAEENLNKRCQLCIELLQESPYNISSYEMCFSCALDETLEVMLGDAQAIITVARWFGVRISTQKKKFTNAAANKISDSYGPEDMQRYDDLKSLEQITGVRTKVCVKIYEEYAEKLISSLTVYTPEGTESTVSALESFENKYDLSFSKQFETLTNKILSANSIDLEKNLSKEVSEIKSDSQKMRVLAAEFSSKNCFKISDVIQNRSDEMDKVLYDLCHVQEIVNYDAKTKKFKTEELLLGDPEDASLFNETTNSLKSLCLSLSANSSLKRKGDIVAEICSICYQSGYSKQLADKLRKRYDAQVRQAKVVKGVTYETEEEADAARKEISTIEQIYDKNGRHGLNELKSFDMLMDLSLQTESGRKEYNRYENDLLKDYNERKGMVAETASKRVVEIIGFFLLALIATLFGIVLVSHEGWLFKCIGICVGLACWQKFIDICRESRHDISVMQLEKRKMKEFRKAFNEKFYVADGHIYKINKKV